MTGVAQLLLDVVDDRVDLTLVGCRCDDEAVGDHQLLRHVEHHDVGRQLLVCGEGRDAGHLECFCRCAHYVLFLSVFKWFVVGAST